MRLDRNIAWNGGNSSVKAATLSRAEVISTYIAVFLAPFASLRFFGINFTASDLLYCTSFVLLLLARRLAPSPLYFATWPWLFGFVLLLTGLLVPSLYVGDPARGLLVCLQYLFAYVILLPIVLRGDIDEMNRLATIFLAGIIVIDVHGILTFYAFGYVPTGGSGKGVVTGANRLATILGNPNLAAAMNALSIPTLFYLWFAGRLSKWLASALFAVIVATVILTSSNSGLAAMTLSTLVFISCVANVRLMMRVAIVALVLATILYVGGFDLLPAAFQKRVLPALSTGAIDEAGSFMSRSALMLEALSVISAKEILFLGIGADQFRMISAQEAPVHNVYLLLWVEGGLAALFGWLVFPAVGLYLGFVGLGLRLERHVIAVSVSTAMVFFLIAFSNAHMYGRYWTTPLLINFGILVAHLRARTIAVQRQEARLMSQRYP